MTKQNFTGYVLAGGKSSRMGADKAFLEIGGRTFLQNASAALSPNCLEVCIVLNKNQIRFVEKLSENSTHIFDIYENRGALGGIHAALKNCRTEFAFILAVDLPFVGKNAVKNLCRVAENSEGFAAIVPRQIDGRLQSLCAVYRVKDCLANIGKILSENDSASVRDFLETVKVKVVEESALGAEKKLFANINSQKDFEALEKN